MAKPSRIAIAARAKRAAGMRGRWVVNRDICYPDRIEPDGSSIKLLARRWVFFLMLGRRLSRLLAGGQGFEPRFYGPEPHVLPLDDPPVGRQKGPPVRAAPLKVILLIPRSQPHHHTRRWGIQRPSASISFSQVSLRSSFWLSVWPLAWAWPLAWPPASILALPSSRLLRPVWPPASKRAWPRS